MKKETKLVDPREAFALQAAASKVATERLHGMGRGLNAAPRPPDNVFEEIRGMLASGAVDMAREVFLDDVRQRERWHRNHTRLVGEEGAKQSGSAGGKAKAERDLTAGGWTALQQTFVLAFRRHTTVDDLSPHEALERIATDNETNSHAVRAVLRRAGEKVVTKERRGRRPR